MTTRPLILTGADRATLGQLLASRSVTGGDSRTVADLLVGMGESTVVDSASVPRTVVTLDSRVLVRPLGRGTERELTLVVPGRSNPQKGYVSVLTPVGSALLGRREGDIVTCDAPAGRFRLRVVSVLHQPEAAGDAPDVFAA